MCELLARVNLDANVELYILHLAAEYLFRPLGAHRALQEEATSVPCHSCETQVLRIVLFLLLLPSRVLETGDGLNEALYLLLRKKTKQSQILLLDLWDWLVGYAIEKWNIFCSSVTLIIGGLVLALSCR